MSQVLEQFNKYAGREVNVLKEHKVILQFGYTDYSVAPNDPTLQAIQKDAQSAGLELSVRMPDTVGTMEFNDKRVNIHVDKDRDEKWRIQRLSMG